MPTDDQQRLDALKRFFVIDHTESEDEIARLIRVAAEVYGVAYAVLSLRDGEGERVAGAYGFDPASLPTDAVFCARTAGPSIPLTVADASADERFARNPLVHGPQAARFYAGVPLKSADGFTLGTLALLDPAAQDLNGEGLALLVDLGALVEPTLNLQQAREAQAEAQREQAAAEATLQEVRQALERAEAHRAALEVELEATRAERDTARSDGDALQAAYEATAAERDAAQAAQAALRRERDDLATERDTLVTERDALAAERDALTAERDTLTSERDALTSERDALTSERDELVVEHDRLKTERDTLATERDRLKTEQDEWIPEREAVATEREAVAAEREAVAREWETVAAEREALVAEREALAAARNTPAAGDGVAEAARADAEAARREAEAARTEAETARREAEAVRKDIEAAHHQTEAARREAHAARREAEAALKEADAARKAAAERDEARAAAEAVAAERDEAWATAEAAATEQAALLQALDQRDRLAAAAAEAAGCLAEDPSALPDALGLVAPEAGASRAVLIVKTASGPAVHAAWHTEGTEPLAAPGERLNAGELDAWADTRGVAHLAALPLPGGLILLDAPAWAPHEEPLFRAAFAPLALALRNREGQDGGDRNRLLSGISHEIRTTLTSILGYAEMLSDEAGPAARPMAERILGSSTRLLQTLDTVLVTARLEAEGLTALKRIDVGAAVEAAAAPFRPRAEARDLAFFSTGTDLDAYAWADATALRHALTHLLVNALTFTDRGGVRLRVFAEGDGVVVEVQDTGVGIAPEFLPHLFGSLQREEGERGRDRKGSGMGLALTKRLVDLMGGEITVTSRKGQGSVFRLVLRSAPAPSAAEHAALSSGDGFVVKASV